MGICYSCCNDSNNDSTDVTPTPDVRRQQILEATEKRLRDEESRGIKNVEKVRKMQEKAEEKERLQEMASKRYDGSSNLRWQMN